MVHVFVLVVHKNPLLNATRDPNKMRIINVVQWKTSFKGEQKNASTNTQNKQKSDVCKTVTLPEKHIICVCENLYLNKQRENKKVKWTQHIIKFYGWVEAAKLQGNEKKIRFFTEENFRCTFFAIFSVLHSKRCSYLKFVGVFLPILRSITRK